MDIFLSDSVDKTIKMPFVKFSVLNLETEIIWHFKSNDES